MILRSPRVTVRSDTVRVMVLSVADIEQEATFGIKNDPDEKVLQAQYGDEAIDISSAATFSHKVNGEKLPGEGYATYRLKILLNKPGQSLALKILEIAS